VSSERQARRPRVMVITDDGDWVGVGAEQAQVEPVSGVLSPAEYAAEDSHATVDVFSNSIGVIMPRALWRRWRLWKIS
jgi:hypothetical protein